MVTSDRALEPKALSSEDIQLPSSTELTQHSYTGAAGREWKLPFRFLKYEGRDEASFVKVPEARVSEETCLFLRAHAPDIYTRWRDAAMDFYAKHDPNKLHADKLSHYDCCRAIVTTTPLVGPPPILSGDVATPAAPSRPSHVNTPTITETHWYYQHHYNVGNYAYHSKDIEQARKDEVSQDIACLRNYLKGYDRLARNITGENLFNATTWAAFRDPYYSCMRMCLDDLQLPSHFLAFIHHGIGVHLALEHRFIVWSPAKQNPAESPLLHATQSIYNRLAELYLEDFPH